jgi:hypothetical protein
MKMIQSLGLRDNAFNPSSGNMMKAEWFLYECPVCLNHIEQKGKRGLVAKTCTKCKGTQKITHGHSDKPYYHVWQAMKARCENPKNKKYHIYGGKGITVCDEWKTFEGFWKDNESLYQNDLTIDRMDSSKGYNKDNIRWITKSQNSSETTKRKEVIQYRVALKPEKHLVEVKQWNSALKAANELGLVASHIGAVCLNKRTSHGGFVWKFKE